MIRYLPLMHACTFYLQVVGWKGLHKWKTAGWRRPNGRPPANLDLWIMFDAQLSGLDVRMEHVSANHQSWGNTSSQRQYLRDRLRIPVAVPVAVRIPPTRVTPQRRRRHARQPRVHTSNPMSPSPPLQIPQPALRTQRNQSFVPQQSNNTTSVTAHFLLSVLVILLVFILLLAVLTKFLSF